MPTVDTTATNDAEVVQIDAEAVEIVESEDGQDEDDEYAGTDDAMQIYQLAQKFIVANGHNTGGNNELDLVVNEMIETIKETGGDTGEIDTMVEGWISMEDNEACINELADEVNELMHVDVFSRLTRRRKMTETNLPGKTKGLYQHLMRWQIFFPS